MIDQYPASNGVLTSLIWRKTMSGGETSLSGYDNASQALSYTPGQEQVYLNGILLVRGDDYTATNGTSITGLSALSASDFVQVNCYNNFSVATLPTSGLTGTIANNQLANSSITINGSAISLGGTYTNSSASTSTAGIVQLTDSTSSTSTTTAATPNSVKSAYDLANGAIQKTLTTTTGDIIYASSANTPARLGIGSTNQVLTVSGGVPAWATVSSGGLVLIGTTSFSAASAVNINDVFSSTYDNYRIVCNFTPSDNGDLNFRYRVSGADNTTSNYYYQGIDIAGTSSTPFRLGAQTNGRLAAAQTNVENSFSADMFAPNLTRKKRTNSYAGRETNSSPGIVFLSTTFDATTSFTGFSLYNNNGTITGTVSVYGYAK